MVTTASATAAAPKWQPVVIMEAPSMDEIEASVAVRLPEFYQTADEAMQAGLQAMLQRKEDGAIGFTANKVVS